MEGGLENPEREKKTRSYTREIEWGKDTREKYKNKLSPE